MESLFRKVVGMFCSPILAVEMNSVLSSFKIKAHCKEAQVQGNFVFYDLVLAPGFRVQKLRQYGTELALQLQSSEPIIKILPEKGIVRLQVARSKSDNVDFEELYASAGSPKGFFPFLLGKTDGDHPFWVDFNSNPHLLVAGGTGSGKSVFLHVLIKNVSKRKDTQLFLIDTKRVEFSKYNTDSYKNIVTSSAGNYEEAVIIFEHLISEMESRYDTMEMLGISNLTDSADLFNKILVIVDEVADLLISDKDKKLENLIVQLAAKCRASGIYLVLATQRPSVNVLSGLIKANFPARLAFRASSRVDSQVILDQPGAEHLLGKGDGLFINQEHDLIRFQSAIC